MALSNSDIRKELKLTSAEFINKSIILLTTPDISDETVYRVYLLLDKLQKGFLDESTFQPDNPVYHTLKNILEKDTGIDPNIKKLFLSLYDSYMKSCNQLILDYVTNKTFNESLQNDRVRKEFNKKFSAFITQFVFLDATKLFPPHSLKTVIETLEEIKSAIQNQKPVDVNSMRVIIDFIQRKSKDSDLVKTTRDLKNFLNTATNSLEQPFSAPHQLDGKKKKATRHITLFDKKENKPAADEPPEPKGGKKPR